MAQARSSAAAKATEVTAAERRAQEAEAEAAEAKGTVMEMAAERESLGESMRTLTKAFTETSTELRSVNGSISGLRTEVSEMKELSEALLNDVAGLTERVIVIEQQPVVETTISRTTEKAKVKAEHAAEDTKHFLRRRWADAKYMVKPGKPGKENVKGAVVTNAAEYLALVTCAQIWPVGTMSTIGRALFVA